MSAKTEILLLIVAFAGLAALPVLIPWVVVRVAVGLLEALPARPAERHPAMSGPAAELRNVEPIREDTEPASVEEPVPADASEPLTPRATPESAGMRGVSGREAPKRSE